MVCAVGLNTSRAAQRTTVHFAKPCAVITVSKATPCIYLCSLIAASQCPPQQAYDVELGDDSAGALKDLAYYFQSEDVRVVYCARPSQSLFALQRLSKCSMYRLKACGQQVALFYGVIQHTFTTRLSFPFGGRGHGDRTC